MRKSAHMRDFIRFLCAIIAVLGLVMRAEVIARADETAPVVAADEAADSCEGDGDCDGVPDEIETQRGTDAQKCDTDADGLSDGVELGYIQPVEKKACHGLAAATSNDRGEAVGTNYKRPRLMDPLNPDSDGDGLKDGEEDLNGNGWIDPDDTDPTINDTDDDDISDYVEVVGDFDGDGFPDFDFSVINNGPRCNPPASISDPDCDGIPSARDDDSDNDGCPDKSEGEWIDSNSNGIPDLFDGQAKSCPDAPQPGGASGARPKGPKEGKENGARPVTPFAGDAADGGACALSPGGGDMIPGGQIGLFLLLTVGLVLLLLKRRGLQKKALLVDESS